VGAAALIVLFVIIWRTQDFAPWLYRGGFLVVALVTATLLAVLAHPSARLGAIMGWGFMRWLGLRSYGIYLWHWPVIALTRPNIDVHLTPWLLVPLQAGAAVGLAALSYKYVEMPVRRRTALPWIRAQLLRLEPQVRRFAAAGATVVALGLLLFVVLRPALPPSQAAAKIPGSNVKVAKAPTKKQIARLPPPKHGAILAVGESVMLGASADLNKRLGAKRLRVDASVGRQAADIITTLKSYRDSSGLPPRVVVQLGDNGPLLGDQPNQIKNVLRGVKRVVLVTPHTPQRWQDTNDAVIKGMADNWPEARVADWNAAASKRPGFLVDGVHPNAEGIRVYTNLIVRALNEN
jgi:hypothetical protein